MGRISVEMFCKLMRQQKILLYDVDAIVRKLDPTESGFIKLSDIASFDDDELKKMRLEVMDANNEKLQHEDTLVIQSKDGVIANDDTLLNDLQLIMNEHTYSDGGLDGDTLVIQRNGYATNSDSEIDF